MAARALIGEATASMSSKSALVYINTSINFELGGDGDFVARFAGKAEGSGQVGAGHIGWEFSVTLINVLAISIGIQIVEACLAKAFETTIIVNAIGICLISTSISQALIYISTLIIR